MTPAHADKKLHAHTGLLSERYVKAQEDQASAHFGIAIALAIIAAALIAAIMVWPGRAHAQPEPSVSRSGSTTADYTYTTAMTNNCPHPVTLSEHQFRHALPMALLCSRLRKLGVGTLLQPGETWTVIVWRKP